MRSSGFWIASLRLLRILTMQEVRLLSELLYDLETSMPLAMFLLHVLLLIHGKISPYQCFPNFYTVRAFP